MSKRILEWAVKFESLMGRNNTFVRLFGSTGLIRIPWFDGVIKYADEMYAETEIYGVQMRMYDVSENKAYKRTFTRRLPYEPALTRYLMTVINKNSIFLDVGAHCGYFTIFVAKLGAKVISVEPHPKFYDVILRNVKLNNLHNVKTLNVALSDIESRALMVWDGRTGITGWSILEGQGNAQVVQFDKLNLHPDVVKIDVHGGEGKTIAGMVKTLRKDVSHLFCELHSPIQGYTVSEIVNMLRDAGLEVLEFVNHRKETGGQFVKISNELLEHPHDRMLYARRKK